LVLLVRADKIDDLERQDEIFDDAQVGSALAIRICGAQHRVSAHDLDEAFPEVVEVDRAAPFDADTNVVGRLPGAELLQQP